MFEPTLGSWSNLMNEICILMAWMWHGAGIDKGRGIHKSARLLQSTPARPCTEGGNPPLQLTLGPIHKLVCTLVDLFHHPQDWQNTVDWIFGQVAVICILGCVQTTSDYCSTLQTAVYLGAPVAKAVFVSRGHLGTGSHLGPVPKCLDFIFALSHLSPTLS